MARKKKFYEEELPEEGIIEDLPLQSPVKNEYVKKLIPTHWAREDGLDEALFLYYDRNGEITREEYDNIKKLVSNKLK